MPVEHERSAATSAPERGGKLRPALELSSSGDHRMANDVRWRWLPEIDFKARGTEPAGKVMLQRTLFPWRARDALAGCGVEVDQV